MTLAEFQWQYGDWRDRTKYPTNKARHSQLVLHIEEVANYIIGIEAAEEGNRTRLDPNALEKYLAGLNQAEQSLDSSLAVTRVGQTKTLARFGRRYGNS